jgi:hypothetical protein
MCRVNWGELEGAAPQITGPGGRRLEETRVALLGTLRTDGSPRISPVEPYLSNGHLLFGAMSWSLKVRDLARDSRCVLHSAITGPNNAEDELKLYGRALEADAEVRQSCREGWWHAQHAVAATVFELHLEQATFISWDLEGGEMRIRRWSPADGFTEATRSYP